MLDSFIDEVGTDGLENPVDFILTGVEAHDNQCASVACG